MTKAAFDDVNRIVGDAHVHPDKIMMAAMRKLCSCVLVGIHQDGSLYIAASDGIEKTKSLLEIGLKDVVERMK